MLQHLKLNTSHDMEGFSLKAEPAIMHTNPPGQLCVSEDCKCEFCFQKLDSTESFHHQCSATKSTRATIVDVKTDCKKENGNVQMCKECDEAETQCNHNDKFTCKLCTLVFNTREEQRVHRLKFHIGKNKIKKKKCRLCPKLNFSSEGEYLYHVSEIHKGKSEHLFRCNTCTKQFKTKTELTQHNKSQCGTIRLYKCKECGLELMTPGSLHNHRLRHKGERSSMCTFCGKTFLTAGQLTVHERSHTREKTYICGVCHKGFPYRQSLITHSTIHTGIKPFSCENCLADFSCVGNLLKHRRTHMDTCGKIPLTTHRVNNPLTKAKIQKNTPRNSKVKAIAKEREKEEKLAAYIKEISTNAETLSNDKIVNDCMPQVLIDRIGEILAPVETDLNVMIYENLQNNTLGYQNTNDVINVGKSILKDETKDEDEDQCSTDIDAVPENKDQSKPLIKFRKHKKPHPSNCVKNKNGNASKRSCKYCNKTYNNERWLSKHEERHECKDEADKREITNSFKCSCCRAGFETRDACKSHQQNEHADILTCQNCDKIFSNADSLRSHQNVFHKGLPKKVYYYICDKCGMQFRQKAFLKHHEQNNCGSEPIYECNVCGKGFSSVYTRRSHLRIHDPNKRFLCKFCGKSFRWKGQLKIHERSHTGEKPFKCLYCPKAFAYRESLLTHSTLHTGIKPHLCQACGSRFSCIGNLIKHKGTHASTCGVWYSKNQNNLL